MEFYNQLELSIDATPDEIRKAYFDMAKMYHPDLNPSPEFQEKFIGIQRAYETLIDPYKRAEYDEKIPPEQRSSKPIQVNAYYSRSAVPLIEGTQVFYLLLDIFPTKDLDVSVLPPVNVCLVLDRSTSMQGSLLEKIKSESINFIKLLRPIDVFSIVAFSDRAEVILEPTKIANITNAVTKIQSLQAFGATEIYQGLYTGVEVLRSIKKDEQVRQLILITDGHTYGDEKASLELIRTATQEGISFQAIGIGEEWNDQFLDEMARIAGGETQFVSNAQEMYNSLTEKIKSLGVLFAQSVRLHFELDPLVELTYAFRYSPDLSNLEPISPVQMGNLYMGKHLRIIFEFKIKNLPDTITEIRIANGTIKLDIPSNPVHKTRLFFDFKRSIRINMEKEMPPSAIVDAMSHLTLYRIQEKARIEVKNGDISRATKHLHHVATHLLARGDRQLAHTVLEEAQNLQAQKSLTELGEKKIKYGTRSLLMLPQPENDKK
jgi:Ca-activated chloride channel family protein